MKSVFLIALLLSTQIFGQTQVDVWPTGKIPGTVVAEPEAAMPAKPDGFKRVTNISRPTLTVFPAKGKRAPAVIVCPGGGYNYVVYDKEGTEVAAWLNSLGITAMVLKYRVPKNRDGALQDVQRAIGLARSRSSEWNIDPKRLGVIGFSAGGNVAAKASDLFEHRAFDVIDSIDKNGIRPDFALLIYPAYLERDGKLAADLLIDPKIPPTFIVTTEDDPISVAGSRIYHIELDAKKIPNQLIVYPDGGHGYGLRSDKSVRAWPQAAAEWLRKTGIIK